MQATPPYRYRDVARSDWTKLRSVQSTYWTFVVAIVLGAGLYLVLIGLYGSAVALLVRHAAAGIAIVVGTLFIVPGVVQLLPSSWVNPIEEYWPAGVVDTNAGPQIFLTHHNSHALSAWQGLGEFALFVGVVIAVAFYFLERRDA